MTTAPTQSLIQVEKVDGYLLAKVVTPKVGAREAQIIENELKAAAAANHTWKIVVDLADVTLLASMGLGMLVTMHKACNQSAGKLVITGTQEELKKLLKLTHLDQVIKSAPDKAAAAKLVQ